MKKIIFLFLIVPLLSKSQTNDINLKTEKISDLLNQSYFLKFNIDNQTFDRFLNEDYTLRNKYEGGITDLNRLLALYKNDPFTYLGINYNSTQKELLKNSPEEKKLQDSIKQDRQDFCNQIYYFDILDVYPQQELKYDLKKQGYLLRLSLIKPGSTVWKFIPQDYKSNLRIDFDKFGVIHKPDAYLNSFYRNAKFMCDEIFLKVSKEGATKIEFSKGYKILFIFDTYGIKNTIGQFTNQNGELDKGQISILQIKNLRVSFIDNRTFEELYSFSTTLSK